ncbi:Hypothetical predicted protein [Olea europaea subsp. europaea]|uniref:Uncharacterized protein n=1 Tax=Olea europaea subsp. europaea TaxID=158383 RepID=A0A8S0S5B9_OLEEU|nr:Hypothetical predicted protein [Olea europaea subsp. europaea]
MSILYQIMFLCSVFSLISLIVADCESCYMHQYKPDKKFEQKSNRFWEFKEESNTWVEVKLPYDLVSCIDDNCTIVNTIKQMNTKNEDQKGESDVSDEKEREDKEENKRELNESSYAILPLRRRVSLTKMSDSSVWVTGESGSIYERFWNGLQWVIAPHDLPVSAGYAVSVFMVNHTILALSEAGTLYQMQLTEDSQPIWIEFMPVFDQSPVKETDQSSAVLLASGVTSQDRETMFLCTKNGSLLELKGVDPPSWDNHGRPPGANVAAIVDAATIRAGVLFTVSAAGDLYEYDQTSKPPWKKHIRREQSREDTFLAPFRGCSLHGLIGAHSVSLFLLTKGGELVERRLHQRKWKWVVHGNPKGHLLSSITCISQDEYNENSNSLFLTTAAGSIFEYQIPKYSDQEAKENWANHMHPPNGKAARGIAGLHLQVGRMIFPLDDGRLAELHLLGLGGENLGPNSQVYTRRKQSYKYVWSVLDAPETEGWNAEYCAEDRGPSNCIIGTKDELNGVANTRSSSRRRKDVNPQQNYLSVGAPDNSMSAISMEEYNIPDNWIKNFRLRLMQGGKSFFLITDSGLTFEYLNTENVWFWLRHEHPTAMKGALGTYNGSIFLVDENGSLLIRERNSTDLTWINCTAMRKGKQVVGGPPWDNVPGRAPKAKAEDAIFFVSKTGRLLQFSVALRKFKWKDCKNPPNTKIAYIVDQEGFRENIVFIIGRNNRLYQYNKVTELWHEHYQSQHLVLSRSPGTATRSSSVSLKGSIFMLSDEGGLVEYQWNPYDGWNWIEHGTPCTNVTLVGSPGPCFGGTELFLIGSDGNVYLRYFDQRTWKWRDCGFPYLGNKIDNNERQVEEKSRDEEICIDKDFDASFEKVEENLQATNKNCDLKVSPNLH